MIGELIPVIAPRRVLLVMPFPGQLVPARRRTDGFPAKGHLETLGEEERMIEQPIPPGHVRERRPEDPEGVVGAEEHRDAHVNPRLRLPVEVETDVDALAEGVAHLYL